MRPLLLDNGDAADPLNPLVIEINEIRETREKKRTEEQKRRLMELEYLARLYWDDEVGIYMPNDNIEACVKEGARRSRRGKAVEAGVFVLDTIVAVEYDGPKTKVKLLADPNFQLRRGVPNANGQRIFTLRPRIPEGWTMTIRFGFDDQVVDKEKDLLQPMIDAGALIGIGAWRPKFGRFEVEVL